MRTIVSWKPIAVFFAFILGAVIAQPYTYARSPEPSDNTGCDERSAYEFHSLRPYEAAPCNRDITDIEYYLCGQDLVGQKRLTFNRGFLPNDDNTNVTQVGACRETTLPTGGTSYDCDYEIEGEVPIQINLDAADLPIMGITNFHPDGQDKAWVNNMKSRAFGILTPAQKMNNYVSWYMNGVTGRAEDNVLTFPAKYPLDPDDLSGDALVRYQAGWTDVHKVIDYSGPIKKLLPWRIQIREREKQANDGKDSDDDGTNAGIRHNQIVGCYYQMEDSLGWIGFIGQIFAKIFGQTEDITNTLARVPGPCYPDLSDFDEQSILGITSLRRLYEEKKDDWTIDMRGDINNAPDITILKNIRIRIADFVSGDRHIPPKSEEYTGRDWFANYWRAYEAWRGRYCSPVIHVGFSFYFCFDEGSINAFGVPVPDLGRPNYWGTFFQYIPFTSTEDRKGFVEIETIATAQPPSDILIEPPVTIKLEPNDSVKRQDLFFPHMQETFEAARLLQQTYVPQGVDDRGPLSSQTIYDTQRCDLVESRRNPGDSLFGNFNIGLPLGRTDQYSIVTELEYKGTFTCTFQPTLDNDCFFNCMNNPTATTSGISEQACVTQCTEEGACTKTLNVATSVYTAVPLVEEVWARYVNGPMSIFKMIFPKVGKESPIEEIKDIPARTFASYSSDDSSVQVFAGDPNNARTGAQAQIFFPHIGSIYDYFLKGIQKALRPWEINQLYPGEDQSNVGNPDVYPPTDGGGNNPSCSELVGTIDFMNPSINPKPLEQLIADLRATNLTNSLQFSPGGLDRMEAALREHYDYVVSRARAAGYNPAFVLSIWIEETGAGAYSDHEFGCGSSYTFEGELTCFLGLYDAYSAGGIYDSAVSACRQGPHPDYKLFMLIYSEGTCSTVQNNDFKFCLNPNFPNRLPRVYEVVAQ